MSSTERGSNSARCMCCISSTKRPERLWGPPVLPSNGYQHSFLGVQRPGCEVDHPPSSSAMVKNERSYTSSPLICLIDVNSDFTFTSKSNGNSVNTNSNNSNIYKNIYSNAITYRIAFYIQLPLVGKLAQ